MKRHSLLNLYTGVVIAVGAGVLAWALWPGGGAVVHAGELAFWIFAAAVVFGEFVPIRVPGHQTELAISTTFIFALLLTYGPETAIVVQAVASALADVRSRKPPRRSMFNVAQYTLAWAAAGSIITNLIDLDSPASQVFTAMHLPAMLLASAIFFLVNSLLVRTAVAISQGRKLAEYFLRDLPFRAWTTAMLMGLAPPVCAVQDLDLVLALLIVLPVAAIHRAATEAARNEYMATHDGLTGLPNRVLFQQRVSEAIGEAAETEAGTFAVMLMDLDRFKEINDTLGHHQGDTLLQQIRPRLEAVLPEGGMAARLGGDEFAVLVPHGGADTDALLDDARRVREAFNDGFEIDGVVLDVGASIGVAIHPAHGDDVETLMKAADVAMYRAKDDKSGIELYEASDDHHSLGQLALARELRLAVENRELLLHYQPKLDLMTGDVREVEALVRWPHPVHGMIPPAQFIPLAEHAGLILPLTSFVLEEALAQVARWRAEGIELCVAINLSARSLLDGRLPEDVGEALQRHGLTPRDLMLEITESAIMADAVRAGRILQRLSDMGIRLAVDDFGTGYSSLSYLKRLPVDEVKIDRSFVMNMVNDPDDGLIVRSVIELTRGLGRTTVAEGVEDQLTLDRLRALGCDIAQGYHVSRPLPAAQLSEWMRGPGFVATISAPPAPRLRAGRRVARPPVR
jgi:diguanylate cyclase (GGDEF)-like protein